MNCSIRWNEQLFVIMTLNASDLFVHLIIHLHVFFFFKNSFYFSMPNIQHRLTWAFFCRIDEIYLREIVTVEIWVDRSVGHVGCCCFMWNGKLRTFSICLIFFHFALTADLWQRQTWWYNGWEWKWICFPADMRIGKKKNIYSACLRVEWYFQVYYSISTRASRWACMEIGHFRVFLKLFA